MKILHIIKNNFRALYIVMQYIPSLLFTSIIQILLSAVQPILTIWYFQYVIDAVIDGKSIKEIFFVTLIMCVLTVVQQVFTSWNNIIFTPKKALVLKKALREKLYRKLVQSDIADYDDNEAYEKITRAMNEVDHRVLGVFNSVVNTLQSAVTLIVSLALVLNMDTYIILFSLASLIISMLFNMKYNKVSYNAQMAQVQDNRKIDYVHRILYLKDYSQDIKATNLSSLLFVMLGKAFHGLEETYDRENPKLMAYNAMPQSISLTITIASVFYVIFRISSGVLSVGSFAALLNGSQSITATIGGLFVFIPQFQQHSMYLDNLFEVLEKSNTIKSGNLPFHGQFSSIEFRNVSFKYPNCEKYTLKDVSFTVNNHEMIGIVGHNGAGKSTLIKLLLRFYDPTEGTILLDGIDYKEYNLADLRKSIGAVFQNYYIYPFSIYENICMGLDEPKSHLEIDNILKDISLYEKIQNLCPGMEKPLSNEFEKGISLSGGEQQKISIARVMYAHHPIVVMDEPSSALDPVSETEIISLVRDKFREQTVFIISHRLSMTKHCNKIIHISDGQIIEYGSHDELMESGGPYSEIYNLQAENYLSSN